MSVCVCDGAKGVSVASEALFLSFFSDLVIVSYEFSTQLLPHCCLLCKMCVAVKGILKEKGRKRQRKNASQDS